VEWKFEGPVEWALIDPKGKRQPVATVLAPIEMPRGSECPLLGANVVIEGALYRCIGVEAHRPNVPIAKGEKIGLLLTAPPSAETPGSQPSPL
jgi:hypothetical protein